MLWTCSAFHIWEWIFWVSQRWVSVNGGNKQQQQRCPFILSCGSNCQGSIIWLVEHLHAMGPLADKAPACRSQRSIKKKDLVEVSGSKWKFHTLTILDWGYWVWVILVMMLSCCCWQFRSALSKHWHLLTFARMHYHLCKADWQLLAVSPNMYSQ